MRNFRGGRRSNLAILSTRISRSGGRFGKVEGANALSHPPLKFTTCTSVFIFSYLNMSINKMHRVAVICPASILNFLELWKEPLRLSPLCIVPHADDAIHLQRRPHLDFGLARDFPTRVGYLGTVPRLSVVLPPMKGTLNTTAYYLQHREVVYKGGGGGAKLPCHTH